MKLFKHIQKNKTKWLFIFTGIASTIWFIIRVIPKPQRATYPCMRAAAPLASSFVIYLLGLGSSVLWFKKFRQYLRQYRLSMALFLLLIAASTIFITIGINPSQSWSATTAPELEEPNTPMGTAVGIFPGRVVWVFDKESTNENCTNNWGDGYFMDKNTDQDVVDSMLIKAVIKLSGKKTIAESWDAIFEFHNDQRGKGKVGYASGEKIFIKLNATSTWSGNIDPSTMNRVDNDYYAISETSPHLVTSVLRHLVNEIGVAETDIYIGDPMKHIYADNYKKWHDEFPEVHYMDNNISTMGREVFTNSTTAKIDYSDRGTVLREGSWESAQVGDYINSDYLYSIFEDMEYMINLPTLKGHKHAGVTMFAKNHFGSHTREDAKHLHGGLTKVYNDPIRNSYGMYRVLVDIMGHELLGDKNLIYIMDALFASDYEVDQPDKWTITPWNNDWSSSVFASLDPVAIESVGFDMLYANYDGSNGQEAYPHYGAVDDYLHQAADPDNWAEGITYDPENDGKAITSLGVHEHWNNAEDMEYSRNLKTGNGIELVQLLPGTPFIEKDPSSGTFNSISAVDVLRVYPTPSVGYVYIDYTSQNSHPVQIYIYDLSGKLMLSKKYSDKDLNQHELRLDNLDNGNYILKITQGNAVATQYINLKH